MTTVIKKSTFSKTTVTSRAKAVHFKDETSVKKLSKRVLQKAIENFNIVNRRKYTAFLKLMPVDEDEELITYPPVKPKYLNSRGKTLF